MTLFNIMKDVTPNPSFSPKKKNKAVDFGKLEKGINAIVQKTIMTKGINRSVLTKPKI